MSECLDRCEAEFDRCLRHGDRMGGMQCIAHRQSCMYGCREEHFEDPPAAGPCTQNEGCPTCASEYQQSVPCSLEESHADYHYCANGHYF